MSVAVVMQLSHARGRSSTGLQLQPPYMYSTIESARLFWPLVTANAYAVNCSCVFRTGPRMSVRRAHQAVPARVLRACQCCAVPS